VAGIFYRAHPGRAAGQLVGKSRVSHTNARGEIGPAVPVRQMSDFPFFP
jgi:hypothetical protein